MKKLNRKKILEVINETLKEAENTMDHCFQVERFCEILGNKFNSILSDTHQSNQPKHITELKRLINNPNLANEMTKNELFGRFREILYGTPEQQLQSGKITMYDFLKLKQNEKNLSVLI